MNTPSWLGATQREVRSPVDDCATADAADDEAIPVEEAIADDEMYGPAAITKLALAPSV